LSEARSVSPLLQAAWKLTGPFGGQNAGVYFMAKRLFGLIGVLGLMASAGVIQASASDDGYNPPPQAVASCDAGHGAFGAFSHNFAFQPGGINWISADAQEDGGLGHATGPNNAGYSASCQAQ
jgi:hypothetical protein